MTAFQAREATLEQQLSDLRGEAEATALAAQQREAALCEELQQLQMLVRCWQFDSDWGLVSVNFSGFQWVSGGLYCGAHVIDAQVRELESVQLDSQAMSGDATKPLLRYVTPLLAVCMCT